MENQLSVYGQRKGKRNALRQMFSSIASNTLSVFPVPGLDVLLARGFNPNQKGIHIASTPRHANVLLVASPLPEMLIPFVENVYAQMPRPRLMVFVDRHQVPSMLSPDFVLSDNDINQLHQKISFHQVWSQQAAPYEPASVNEKENIYTCPMHPEIESDKPGNCPICGMALVKKETEEPAKKTNVQGEHQHQSEHQPMNEEGQNKETYTCPMHPEVQSDEPGNCPKCGMTLVKKVGEQNEDKGHSMAEHDMDAMQNKQEVENVGAVYTCPMHPEVQSDEPGNCPKCVMTLVQKDGENQSGDANKKDDGKHPHHQHIHGDMKNMPPQQHRENSVKKKEQSNRKQEMKGHDMTGHEGHGEMEGMGGGFMSMVQMTKDMPRSEDGLAMEMNNVFFGPFHPGLPGGLIVKMKLDGDTVMKADIKKDIFSQPLLHHFPEGPQNLALHIAKTNPLLHQTFKLLVYKALTNISGKNDCPNEVNILEKDRILHHLNWLSTFSKTIGSNELHHTASGLCYALHSGNARQTDILNLVKKIKKTPYLKKRLSNIACIPDNLLQQISGPLARAAGKDEDTRLSMPAYHERNFKPVLFNENNAWGQLLVRLGEIEQSMELLGEENLNRKFTVPEIVINDYKGNQKGEAFLEAPNGKVYLQAELAEGKVKSISLETASAMLATLVPEITKGKEIADALVSIAALNISPWELDLQQAKVD